MFRHPFGKDSVELPGIIEKDKDIYGLVLERLRRTRLNEPKVITNPPKSLSESSHCLYLTNSGLVLDWKEFPMSRDSLVELGLLLAGL